MLRPSWRAYRNVYRSTAVTPRSRSDTLNRVPISTSRSLIEGFLLTWW